MSKPNGKSEVRGMDLNAAASPLAG